MKKLISLLLAAMMMVMLAIPCFAVKAAKFSLKPVSETDSEIVLSIDYDGGSTFNCIDVEIVYNDKKLKPTEAYDGDGLEAFIRNLKKQGGAGASAINKDTNPIKGSLAVTSMFKVVNGKDLFVLKFKKLSKAKVTADDVEVVFTNCASENEKVKASVTNQLSGGTPASTNSEKTSAKSDPKNDSTTAASTNKTDAGGTSKTTAAEGKTDVDKSSSADAADVSGSKSEDESELIINEEKKPEDNYSKNDSMKKTIIIVAAAICVVFAAITVCIYFSKKKDNKG